MPIVSRRLSYIQARADGNVHVRESVIDSNGVILIHGPYVISDEAAAVAAMNDRDWTSDLEDIEEEVSVEFIRLANSPSLFSRTDLTEDDLFKRITLRFMEQQLRDDQDFMLEVASWLSVQLIADIASFMSTTEVRAQPILDRAIDLAATKSDLDIDDGRTEDLR